MTCPSNPITHEFLLRDTISSPIVDTSRQGNTKEHNLIGAATPNYPYVIPPHFNADFLFSLNTRI